MIDIARKFILYFQYVNSNIEMMCNKVRNDVTRPRHQKQKTCGRAFPPSDTRTVFPPFASANRR
jgi:hypothetical protein